MYPIHVCVCIYIYIYIYIYIHTRLSHKAKGRSFYRIPKDPDRRLKWFPAIERANQHKMWD